MDACLQAVKAQSMIDEPCKGLKVVYTPLNGTGLIPVTRILDMIGVDDVTVVPEQAQPDGNFTTCPFPNPEIREALQKGLDLCEHCLLYTSCASCAASTKRSTTSPRTRAATASAS